MKASYGFGAVIMALLSSAAVSAEPVSVAEVGAAPQDARTWAAPEQSVAGEPSAAAVTIPSVSIAEFLVVGKVGSALAIEGVEPVLPPVRPCASIPARSSRPRS